MNFSPGTIPYFGANERNAHTQLARVESVDPDTGMLSVNYITTSGADSDVMYVHPMCFSPTYGIMAQPTVGSIVEVTVLQDKTKVCKPAFIQYKVVKGTLDPATLVDEVTNGNIHPLSPGEMVILGDGGAAINLDNTGAIMLSDAGGSTIRVDQDEGGIRQSATRTLSMFGADSYARVGVVRRFKPVTAIGTPGEDEMESVQGMYPFQEFNLEVTTAQPWPSPLQGVSLQMGDIFEGTAGVYTYNPALMGVFKQRNLAGLANTKWELYRATGGYSVDIGLLDEISNKYGVLPGVVSEECVGARSLKALSLQSDTTGPTKFATPLSSLELKEAGYANLVANLEALVQAAKATIEATGGDALLKATAVASVQAPTVKLIGTGINLGSSPAGYVAITEKLITVISGLITYLTAVKSHTHPASLGTTSPSLELAAIPVPPPPTPTQVGSMSVTVQA